MGQLFAGQLRAFTGRFGGSLESRNPALLVAVSSPLEGIGSYLFGETFGPYEPTAIWAVIGFP